MEIIISLSFS